MADIKNLERQHEDIRLLMSEIKNQVYMSGNKEYLQENVDHIVKNINILSGKLKVHMSTEDRYLYPAMKISENPVLRKASKEYSSEMTAISEAFVSYKSAFNTRSKVLANDKEFVHLSQTILKKLETRMDREDKELYPVFKLS